MPNRTALLATTALSGVLLAGSTWVPAAAQPSPVFNWTGSAVANVFVPEDSSLLGARFFAQAFVADRHANAFGATTSNGGEGRVGAR